MLSLYFLEFELVRCVWNQSLYMDLDHVGAHSAAIHRALSIENTSLALVMTAHVR